MSPVRRLVPTATLLACPLLIGGCGIGLIYTHRTTPLTTDFHQTPVGTDTGDGDVKTIRYYLQVQWDENGIGEIAKRNGIDEIYYADLETLSVFGIWNRAYVRIHGKRARPSGSAD